MKTMIKLPVILLGVFLFFAGTTQKVRAQGEDISLQTFYDELSPYGVWIKDPQYGYVWRPDVDQGEFRPYYTNGRWAMTEYGNTWVSYYDWGWAPFHYGRWVYNRYNQWVWIPDTIWGPAWVTWRSGGGYYGWAPLGPSITIGINFGRYGYRIPDMCWNFVPYSSIYYTSFPRYYHVRNRVYIQKTVIINNTYVRNNRTYYTGPRAEEIRRTTNQNVTVYNINRSSRPGATRIDNKTVNIYNPRPERGSANTNSAPRNVIEGSINRGTVGRDGNTVSRADRGRSDDVYQADRNMNSRPSRDGQVSEPVRSGRGIENRNTEAPQRVERGNFPAQERSSGAPERTERNREMPQQRMERPQSQERNERALPQQAPQQAPQRMESRPQPQAPQRSESRPQPQQQAPQRSERAERQQSAPQRVERSSSGSSQRSSGGESSRSRSESSGGGRVRGGE